MAGGGQAALAESEHKLERSALLTAQTQCGGSKERRVLHIRRRSQVELG